MTTTDTTPDLATASTLCVAGIVKHVAARSEAGCGSSSRGPRRWRPRPRRSPSTSQLRLGAEETVDSVLADHAAAAARTAEVVAATPDPGASHPLPEAPWFEPGTRWSARRVLYHLIAETAQHAGHADIIRESIDGQRTMG